MASIERSVAFYRDVLGFAVTVEMLGAGGKLAHAEIRRGAATIMLTRLYWRPEDARANLANGLSIYLPAL